MSFLKYTSAAGKFLFPSLLWKKEETSRIIYLTFDDGPIPVVTPAVLTLLKEYDARATFFCIGDNVQKHPEIFQQVLAEGHSIGNHTFNHLNGWKTSPENYFQNVLLAEEAIIENSEFQISNSNPSEEKGPATNNNSGLLKDNIQRLNKNREQEYSRSPISNSKLPMRHYEQKATENRKQKTYNLQPTTDKEKLFRPPYGRIKPSQIKGLKKLGYTTVMWDVISGDYDSRRSAETCYKEVVSQAGPGSIVVFHDSEKAAKNVLAVLPMILEYYKKEGYGFRSL